MGTTRTPGIIVDTHGRLTIDKEYRGLRLFRRLGHIPQEQAELLLENEVGRLQAELHRQSCARPLFRHCAARYLWESRSKRSAEAIT